jgi:hypothetical protein
MAGHGGIHDTICEAIRTRRTLMYVRNGKSRIVEPHQYGVTYDADAILLSWRWETSGSADAPATGSGPTSAGGWERVRLDEMHAVQIYPKTFEGPRPGYTRENKEMREIYAQL